MINTKSISKIIYIGRKGALTLPIELRKKYQLEDGDPVTIVDLDEGFFISPKHFVIPKLVAQIEDMRVQFDVSLSELIEGVQSMRKNNV